MANLPILPILPTDQRPDIPSRLVKDFSPSLMRDEEHFLCSGCGEPIAMRGIVEMIDELSLANRTISVVGIGC